MASITKSTAVAKPSVKASKPKRQQFDATATPRRLNASYDAARRTEENSTLWQYVDGLSAAAANTPSVRKTIRDRARYETANNGYADGIADTLANDTIGPAVQLQLGDTEFAQGVEREFERWATAVNLWGKLRLLRRAKVVDGEVFAMMINNPRVNHEIKLDIRPIECDMIEGWYGNVMRDDEVDGIRFDEQGNPTQYRMLRSHPGDVGMMRKGGPLAGDWISARWMCHYFSTTRPGQVRGVSEILPALSLFGQLRRYTAAVIECASRAAEISAIMHTDLLPDNVAAELDALTIINAERNAIVSLPEGWKMSQLKAEQPTTQYGDFKGEIINEIARCLSMPYNVAAGNSSGYNYASGRLDHQTYDRNIEVERKDIVSAILDRVLEEWSAEYATRHSFTAEQQDELQDHEWHFASRDHVDPAKEANADNTRLQNGTLTYASYYAKRGKDWKREERQRVRERITRELLWNEEREKAGLQPSAYPGDPAAPNPPQSQEEPEEKDED